MRRGGCRGVAGASALWAAALCALLAGQAAGQIANAQCPQFVETSQTKVTAAGCENAIEIHFSMLSSVYAKTNIAIIGVRSQFGGGRAGGAGRAAAAGQCGAGLRARAHTHTWLADARMLQPCLSADSQPLVAGASGAAGAAAGGASFFLRCRLQPGTGWCLPAIFYGSASALVRIHVSSH